MKLKIPRPLADGSNPLKPPKPPKLPHIPKRPRRPLTPMEAKVLVDTPAWAKERLRRAAELEKYRKSAGRAKVMIELRVYYPSKRGYIRIPGWNLKVLVGTGEHLELAKAIELGVESWTSGLVKDGKILCPRCGE